MSTLTVATVKSNSSDPPAFQNTSGTEIGRLCRAYVDFNGTGTVAINSQYNVSSITDNGVGDYTVNFANALADSNYVATMQGSGALTGTTWHLIPGLQTNSGSTTPTLKTSSAVRITLFNPYNQNAGLYDAVDCGVAIFR